MIDSVLLQSGVTAILIYRISYFVALAALASMLLLAFRIDKDYHDGIYLLFGTVAFLCFSFSWGGENFGWPIPGLIWLVGIVVLSFMQGLFLAFLLPFDADVLVRR